VLAEVTLIRVHVAGRAVRRGGDRLALVHLGADLVVLAAPPARLGDAQRRAGPLPRERREEGLELRARRGVDLGVLAEVIAQAREQLLPRGRRQHRRREREVAAPALRRVRLPARRLARRRGAAAIALALVHLFALVVVVIVVVGA